MKEVLKRRETWVDNVKLIACILVVVGHFGQSMVAAGLSPENTFYRCFIETLYCFHVKLFFICSGYLYQKYSKVNSLYSWTRNIGKKALALGVPYFVFTMITWVLKEVFSGSVNGELGSIADTLFFHPASPYWYLYALFFIFLITPTFKNKKFAIIGLAVALAMKMYAVFGNLHGIMPLVYVFQYEIMFAIGMFLCFIDFSKVFFKRTHFILSILLGVIFLVISVLSNIYKFDFELLKFVLSIIACYSVIGIVTYLFRDNHQNRLFGFLTKYTMPIFLMHTIFAASLRSLLLRLGVVNLWIHVILGLAISFAGPIIAAIIMKKTKWLEFFLYPGKFIKISKRENEPI